MKDGPSLNYRIIGVCITRTSTTFIKVYIK